MGNSGRRQRTGRCIPRVHRHTVWTKKKESYQWTGALWTAYPLPLSTEAFCVAQGHRPKGLKANWAQLLQGLSSRRLWLPSRRSLCCRVHTSHTVARMCWAALRECWPQAGFTLVAAARPAPAARITRAEPCLSHRALCQLGGEQWQAGQRKKGSHRGI